MDCVPQQLFGSAVAYYAQYRPSYPQGLVDALAARTGLNGTQRVLDIGCGSGQMTIPLARHAQEVVAIDPLPGMLAGRRPERLGRPISPGLRVTPVTSSSSPDQGQIWPCSPRPFTGPTGTRSSLP